MDTLSSGLLWGVILLLHLILSYYMCGGSMAAAAPKNNIKSSFCGKSFKKSESLLFLALVLVASASFLVLFLSFSVTFDHGSKTGSLMALNRRTLLEIPSRNMNLHHQHVHQKTTTFAAATSTRNDREFQMAAHEVPSGPNPESN